MIMMLLINYLFLLLIVEKNIFIDRFSFNLKLLVLLTAIISLLFFNFTHPILFLYGYLGLQLFFFIRYLQNYSLTLMLFVVEYLLISCTWLFIFEFIPWDYLHFNTATLFHRLFLYTLQQSLLIMGSFFLTTLFEKIEIDRQIAIHQGSNLLIEKIGFIVTICLLAAKSFLSYPNQKPSYFALVILFLLTNLIASYTYLSYKTLKSDLSLKTLELDSETEKAKYQAISEFQHDYKNILSSLTIYLEKNEIDEAKNYLKEIIDYSADILKPNYYTQIKKITIPAIQGLLLNFVDKCNQKNITLKLDIEPIEPIFSIQTIELIRLLSILLDNAYEHSLSEKNPEISFSVTDDDQKTSFEVTNTYTQPIEIENIMQKGYTTKQNHSGQGLAIFLKIIKRNPTLNFFISAKDGLFSVKLLIENKSLQKSLDLANSH